jgi:hypothetical protein
MTSDGKVTISEAERHWLERLAITGTGPDRPFLRDKPTSIALMQKGLVEVVQPQAPYLSFAKITDAGRALLSRLGIEKRK